MRGNLWVEIGQRKAGRGRGKDELNEQQLEAKWRSVSFPLFVEGHQKRHFLRNVLQCVCVPFMLLSCVNQHCTQTCIHTYYLLERVTCSIVSYHFICSSASALHTHGQTHTCMHAWEERPLVKCGVLIRAATQASLEVQDAILLRLLVQSLVLRKVCVCVCVRV